MIQENIYYNNIKQFCIVVGHQEYEIIGACVIQLCRSASRKYCQLCLEQKLHINDENYSLNHMMSFQDIEKEIKANRKEYEQKLDDLFADYYYDYLYILGERLLSYKILEQLEKVEKQLASYNNTNEINLKKYLQSLTDRNTGVFQYLQPYQNNLKSMSDNLFKKLRRMLEKQKHKQYYLIDFQKKKIELLINLKYSKVNNYVGNKYIEQRFLPPQLLYIEKHIQEYSKELFLYEQSMRDGYQNQVKLEVLDKILQVDNNHQPTLKEKGRVVAKIQKKAQRKQYRHDKKQQTPIVQQKAIQFNDNPIQYYDAAIERNPLDDDTYYLKGKALLQQHKNEDAISIFQKAINLNPNKSVYYRGLGISYQETKKYNEALEQFNKGIKIDPQFIELYIFKAEILLIQNNHTDARQVLEAGLKIDQENLTILETLGFLYFRLEHFEEALKISEKGLDIFTQSFSKMFKQQKQYQQLQKLKAKKRGKFIQEQGLNQSELNDAYFLSFFKLRGFSLSKLGKHEEAIQNYKFALITYSEIKAFYRLIGIELIQLKKYDEALKQFDYSISKFPQQQNIYLKKVETLLYLNQIDEALFLNEKCLTLFPTKTECFKLISQILSKENTFDQAMLQIQNALLNSPSDDRLKQLKVCFEIIKPQILNYFQPQIVINQKDEQIQFLPIEQYQQNQQTTIQSSNKKILKIQCIFSNSLEILEQVEPQSQNGGVEIIRINQEQQTVNPNDFSQGTLICELVNNHKTQNKIQLMTHEKFCQQGQVLLEKKDYSSALAKFEKAQQMKPDLYQQKSQKESILKFVEQNQSLLQLCDLIYLSSQSIKQ